MNVDSKKIKKILESNFWLETLKTQTTYKRSSDDTDGELIGHNLFVNINPDGDAYLFTDCPHPYNSLRFRTYCGGGRSLRVRNALLILAEAIRLDQEEKPDPK